MSNHETQTKPAGGASVLTGGLAGRPCPDCGAKPGEQHNDWCDVERCPDCGGQLISCDCEGEFTMPRMPWTGMWPGVMECREFGWYSKMVPGKGWQACSKDDRQAGEDLNRLGRDAVWSKEQGRFILPANAEITGRASGPG
jgi:hypothetical protein